MIRILMVLVVGLFATSCGPIPQPFQGTAKVTADVASLDVPSAVGIAVVPVAGVPRPASDALTKALAKGLEPFEIPAEAVPRNTGLGFTLQGTAVNPTRVDDRVSGDILWRLKSRQGRDAGTYLQGISLSGSEWDQGQGETLDRAGRDAATAIAQLIDGSTAQAAGGNVTPAVNAQAAPQKPLRISVKPAEGAPGDGQEALQLAMLEMLLNNGLKRDDVNPEIVLMGRVVIEPAQGGEDFVTISWRAITQDGAELGDVKLSNSIPKGALEGRWGATAFAIAEAGLPQIMELVALAPRF
jgi:hypothetical protein